MSLGCCPHCWDNPCTCSEAECSNPRALPVYDDRLRLAWLRITELEKQTVAIVKWLEENQPDVFSRGIWDAVNRDKP